MRRAAKVDVTHDEIRRTLRRLGWKVKDTHQVKGWIDMVAYHPARGLVILVDAKTNKGRLTDAQAQLVADGWPIKFLRSADEAARI